MVPWAVASVLDNRLERWLETDVGGWTGRSYLTPQMLTQILENFAVIINIVPRYPYTIPGMELGVAWMGKKTGVGTCDLFFLLA